MVRNDLIISRRRLLATGSAGAALLALAACGEAHDEGRLDVAEDVAGASRAGGGPSAELDGGAKFVEDPTDMVGPVGIGQNDERKDIYVVTSDNKLFEFTKDGVLNYWTDGGSEIDYLPDGVTVKQHPFESPTDTTLDRTRVLWVLDAGNAQVQKFSLYQGRPEGHMNVPKIWGDPELQGATQLRSSGFGFPYIITADEKLLRFKADGTDKTVIEAPGAAGVWRGITAVPVSGEIFGLLWDPDEGASKLYKVTRVGLDYEIEHQGDLADLSEPGKMSANRDDQFFVIDPATDQIHRFEIDGTKSATFGGSGSGPGEFSGASGLQAGVEGVYVSDSGNNRVQHFDSDGNFIAEWGGAGAG